MKMSNAPHVLESALKVGEMAHMTLICDSTERKVVGLSLYFIIFINMRHGFGLFPRLLD